MTFVSNAWYVILDERELPRRGQLRRIRRFSTDLIVWRGKHRVVVVQEDRCPHKGAPLSLGRVVGGCVRCPYHGMEFDEWGGCTRVPQFSDQRRIPKGFGVKTYPVHVQYGLVWLWWGDSEPDTELPFFPEIAVERRLTRAVSVAYPVSFIRMMESHFDLYHVDHLHGWPLRLGKVIVESKTETHDRYIRCENVHEDPLTGRRRSSRTTVLFPGLSLQEGGPAYAFKILAAAAPIDERRSFFLMRHYFAPFHLPVVGRFMNAVNNLNSVYRVLPEDFRVQSRVVPLESGMGADQLILAADRGVLEYWRMVRRALAEAPEARARSARLSVLQETSELE